MNFSQKFFKILQIFCRIISNLTVNLIKHLFIHTLNLETSFLNEKINSEIASENFQNLLKFYGLNSSKSLISTNKRWNKFLFLLFSLAFIKTFIIFNLDPIEYYQLCVYLGDVTLLFQGLRKYFIIILLLLTSFAIHLNYLFNHNPNTEWLEIFSCLDGTLTPKSVGIKSSEIVKKMLFVTKICFKLVKLSNICFCLIIIIFTLYLLLKDIRFVSVEEILIVILWLPSTMFIVYMISGLLMFCEFCFLIIYFCWINAKYFNRKLADYKCKLIFGFKKFIMKLKFKLIFKQQNEFSIRILKYNKFWSKFYLIMMIHIIPCHIIIFQQSLYGNLNFELKIIFGILLLYQTIFIVFSSLFVCLLDNSMILLSKKLIQLQFNCAYNFDIRTKLKVSYSMISSILLSILFYDIFFPIIGF